MSTLDVREGRVKILVIGSKGHTRAHCIDWLGAFPNIEEYDSVIINLSSLTQEVLDKIGTALKKQIGNAIWTLFRTNREAFCILAKPMKTTVGLPLVGARTKWFSNYDWFPYKLQIASEKVGTSVLLRDLRFQDYFRWLEQWNFELSVDLGGDWLYYYFVPIAVNKSEKTIAGSLKIRSSFSPNYTGAIHLLPPPTECDSIQTVEMLLDVILEKGKRVEPTWRKEIEIPGVKEIQEEISKRTRIIEGIHKEINDFQSQITELDNYRDLFSASGEDLENIVQKTLSEIGIPTEKSEKGFPADLISDKVAVEVTGTKGIVSVSSEKVNQTGRFKESFQKSEKIILIANTHMDLNPSGREGKVDFTPEVKKYFDAIDVCYMTSKSLFELWKDIRTKKRKADTVIGKILSHKGELTLRNFTKRDYC